MTTTYDDFEVMISPGAGGGYVARVVKSLSGDARHEFQLDDVQPLLHSLQADPKLSGDSAQAAGRALYEAVFAGDIETAFARSLDKAEDGLRIRLRLSETPELAVIPWEYLYRDADQKFLALFVDTPIVRHVDLADPIEPLEIEPPLRVLVMIPKLSEGLDVEREWKIISEATTSASERGLIEVERLVEPTYAGLQRLLRQRQFHVFHFVGHGGFSDAGGFLAFDGPDGKLHLVSGTELGPLIADHQTMRLVVLNACEGARSSADDTFAGVAQTMIANGIPAIAAMQGEVSDRAAIGFSSEFYAAVAEGLPIDEAMTVARKALLGIAGGPVEWGTPALYMRATDGQLFDVDRQFDVAERGLDSKDWSLLVRRLQRQRVTPIIGWSASRGAIPSRQEIADDWAKKWKYPFDDAGDLTKVAQYMAVSEDRLLPREEIAALAGDASLADSSEVYAALAALPVPIYITTNFDDLLKNALINANKTPNMEICPWRNPPADPHVTAPGLVDEPSESNPIVYHLLGHPDDEESLVLTEDDYFDFVVSVSRNPNVIRPRIIEALAGTSLVMLGYRLDDWMFRIIVRCLIAASESSARGLSVAVQLTEPDDTEFVGDYMKALFNASEQNKLGVYWGSAADFATDFVSRYEAAQQ